MTSRLRKEPEYGVDERLVMPETRFEVIDGEVVYVSPAEPPHATRHSELSALLEAHVADGFDCASDMLTRTSELGDMAPDASVFPAAPDPRTGERQLEQLAFEIAASESLAHAGRKASRLSARGLRRVFAIDVDRRRALEWSPRTETWKILANDGQIADPALAVPLPVAALVGAARADDAVARALLARGNAVLLAALDERAAEGKTEGKAEGKTEGKIEGKIEGRIEGKIEALLAVLASRGVRVGKADWRKIRAARDDATLDAWLLRATACSSARELLAAGSRPARRPRGR